jgi:hypothetical protein
LRAQWNESGSGKKSSSVCALTAGHAQQIESSKGSVFLLCALSKTDQRFPKYPRIPVLACSDTRANPVDFISARLNSICVTKSTG